MSEDLVTHSGPHSCSPSPMCLSSWPCTANLTVYHTTDDRIHCLFNVAVHHTTDDIGCLFNLTVYHATDDPFAVCFPMTL